MRMLVTCDERKEHWTGISSNTLIWLRRREGLGDPARALEHFFKPLVHHLPVHDVPKCIDEFRSLVLIVEIVGVLPNVKNHDDAGVWVDVDIVLLYLHYDRPFCLHIEHQRRPS